MNKARLLFAKLRARAGTSGVTTPLVVYERNCGRLMWDVLANTIEHGRR
ncbi:hypothetical protein GQ55_3G182500 [Panicum hallii var. hallii]|uniref:Uncharacterized protein n=2 Tax=Panicum hallii TaxID=206008 RepID=A0A2T7EAS3_9POAL|nr:hypothetical protein GQ55_3G182500 [Panicum hallii var. hallii]PVH62052.1 hypothetical protein PAHAL_3G193200 [Panicum hallii]